MTELRKKRYMLWDFGKNEPFSNEIYDTLKGCKSAYGHIQKQSWQRSNSLGVIEVELTTTQAWKKVDKDWIEIKGVAKLLYV